MTNRGTTASRGRSSVGGWPAASRWDRLRLALLETAFPMLFQFGQSFVEDSAGNLIAGVVAEANLGSAIFGRLTSAGVLPGAVGWIRYPVCEGKGFVGGVTAGSIIGR
jgi:hypothetical protein